jgi:uncharacterized protein with HEPN domain/predicted nucleotidyltransferase
MRENVKQGYGMDKSTIITTLRAHESELKAAGIEHLSLHGSYARGTAVLEMSDVDVIAEFTPGRRLSLLDMVALEHRLTEMLGIRVDLSPAKGLRSQLPPKLHKRPWLPFRDPALSLQDILNSIDMIVQFVQGMDLREYREDPKTVAAVERKLLPISEAATRLGEDADRLCPGLPLHNIRGIGNWLRHRYDRVDVETVWNTVDWGPSTSQI